jgi:uncharacterized protein
MMRFAATAFFDLYRPSECARRVALRHQGVEPDEPEQPFREVLKLLGSRHEAAHLATIAGILDLSEPEPAQREEQTLAAIEAGAPAIYQPRFRTTIELDGETAELVGEPDFLLRADDGGGDGYVIRDSKLARKIGKSRVEIHRQLQIYGLLYERATGRPPRGLEVHTGTGEIVPVEYEGEAPILEALADLRRKRLAPEDLYEPVGWSKCKDCGYRSRCWTAAEAARDPSLLPDLTQAFARKLRACGVTSLDRLRSAVEEPETRGLFYVPATKKRPETLRDTAGKILRNLEAFETGSVLRRQPVLVPDPSSCVAIDLESLPAFLHESEKVYLWGLKDLRSTPSQHLAIEAGFGPDGDREGWMAFLEAADRLLQASPRPTFIHWGNFEQTGIGRYAERFGDPDGVAARVSASMVDLLQLVRSAFVLPVPSYGLKVVEKLAGFERQESNGNGSWAIARYIEATETSDPVAREIIVAQIRAYNEEDLEALGAVLRWVRGLQTSAEPAPSTVLTDPPVLTGSPPA